MKNYTGFHHRARYGSVEYDIDPNESVSTAVVRAVSAVEGRKPDSLPTLEAVLDSDALDTLFAPQADGTLRKGGRVSLVYSDCRVTIDNGEYLTIQPLEIHRHAAIDEGSSGGCAR